MAGLAESHSAPHADRAASSGPPPRRKKREDARLTHERLLSVARTVFAEMGPEAALEEIVRRAEVGSGTLYRHFPTRMDLIQAVLHERLEALLTSALDLADAPCPAQALTTWLRAVVQHSSTYRGLAAWLMAQELDQEAARTSFAHNAVRAAGGLLLRRAQETGEVRSDIAVADVLKLVNAIAWATEQSPEEGTHGERMLQVVIDGLHAPSQAGMTCCRAHTHPAATDAGPAQGPGLGTPAS